MNVPRVVHEGVSELVVVDTMHTRKATMARLSDAFIALPGGLGTFEELFETQAALKNTLAGVIPKSEAMRNLNWDVRVKIQHFCEMFSFGMTKWKCFSSLRHAQDRPPWCWHASMTSTQAMS